MSEYQKLQLLKEVLAYSQNMMDTYDTLVEFLYTNGNYVHIYTLDLAYKLAEQYRISFNLKLGRTYFGSINEVIDFIKDNEEGDKND